jgi:hypothetical protein
VGWFDLQPFYANTTRFESGAKAPAKSKRTGISKIHFKKQYTPEAGGCAIPIFETASRIIRQQAEQ